MVGEERFELSCDQLLFLQGISLRRYTPVGHLYFIQLQGSFGCPEIGKSRRQLGIDICPEGTAINRVVLPIQLTFPYKLLSSFLIIVGILFGANRIVCRMLDLNQRPPVDQTDALTSAPNRLSTFYCTLFVKQ